MGEVHLSMKTQPKQEPKLPYIKPRLENLGLVREMTLSGSGDANESAGQNTMCADPMFNVNQMCTVG